MATRNINDADDGASIRSYAPTIEAGGYQESILGEVMGPTEKSEQEKSLLRSLGQRFADAESQSMFPPDPDFEAAFRHEFDGIDGLNADGSNEGEIHAICQEVTFSDRVNRSDYVPVARKTQAFPHSLQRWQAYLQSPWRRPIDHKLHWCCTDHYIILPVHPRHSPRLHCR